MRRGLGSTSRRWRYPRVRVVASLDLVITFAVYLLLNALALRMYDDLPTKARVIEVLLAASAARMDIVERFAVTGEPFDMPVGRHEVVTQRQATEHMRRTDRSPNAARNPFGRQPPADVEKRAETATKYVAGIRIEGSMAIVRARLEPYVSGEPSLVLSPLVSDEGVPEVVRWQCGGESMPDGWTGPTVVNKYPIPDRWLPSLCRGFGPTR